MHPLLLPTRKTIDVDTPILPLVVADSVVDEAAACLGAEIPRTYSDRLAARADEVYAHNEHFARRIRSVARGGNVGRDTLYVFMRHWLAGYLKREAPVLFARLPYGYALGLAPAGSRLPGASA